MSLPNVVFVLGGPGAGKGTQCQHIAQTYDFVHLCAGDMLRKEAANNDEPQSEDRAQIKKFMQEGAIVPVEITCRLLAQAMKEEMALEPPRCNFLLDGFPRNNDNVEGWEKEMSKNTNLLFVLYFECSDQTSMYRCIQRGEEGSGRLDDNAQSMRKRIDMNAEVKLVIDYYESLGLVRKIDSDRPVEQVSGDVDELFKDAIPAG